MLEVKQVKDGVIFKIRVQPRASKTEIAGLYGDSLKIKVASPPVDGIANKACLEFLADKLGVSKSSISLISGFKGRNKTIKVCGINSDDVKKIVKKD